MCATVLVWCSCKPMRLPIMDNLHSGLRFWCFQVRPGVWFSIVHPWWFRDFLNFSFTQDLSLSWTCLCLVLFCLFWNSSNLGRNETTSNGGNKTITENKFSELTSWTSASSWTSFSIAILSTRWSSPDWSSSGSSSGFTKCFRRIEVLQAHHLPVSKRPRRIELLP